MIYFLFTKVSVKTLSGKLQPSKLTMLPGNVQWLRLLPSGKVLCGYPSGFATMNLNDKLMTPESMCITHHMPCSCNLHSMILVFTLHIFIALCLYPLTLMLISVDFFKRLTIVSTPIVSRRFSSEKCPTLTVASFFSFFFVRLQSHSDWATFLTIETTKTTTIRPSPVSGN